MRRFCGISLLCCLLALLCACGRPADGPSPDTAETPPVETTVDEPTPDSPDEPVAAPPAAGVEPLGEADAAVPQIDTGLADADAVINDYYRNQAAKYADADAAGETVTADYLVTYNGGHTLSLLRTTDVDGQTTLIGETWNTESGGLYPADALFTDENFAEILIAAVLDQLEGGETALFYQNWQTLVRASFDKQNFCLHTDGYCVFYQPGDLCDEAVQIVIPYAELDGIFAPPEPDLT